MSGRDDSVYNNALKRSRAGFAVIVPRLTPTNPHGEPDFGPKCNVGGLCEGRICHSIGLVTTALGRAKLEIGIAE